MTASLGYPTTAVLIAIQNVFALVLELSFIKIVYAQFPVLRIDEERRREMRLRLQTEPCDAQSMTEASGTDYGAWIEFLSLPIFYCKLYNRFRVKANGVIAALA